MKRLALLIVLLGIRTSAFAGDDVKCWGSSPQSPKSKTLLLHRAILSNDLPTVLKYARKVKLNDLYCPGEGGYEDRNYGTHFIAAAVDQGSIYGTDGRTKRLAVIRALLENGADPRNADPFSWDSNEESILELLQLFQHFKYDVKTAIIPDRSHRPAGVSVLWMTARVNWTGSKTKLLRFLLDAGVNVDWGGNLYNSSPLYQAVQVCHRPEAVRILIEAGANVNNSKSPPLAAAALGGCAENVKSLLAAGSIVRLAESDPFSGKLLLRFLTAAFHPRYGREDVATVIQATDALVEAGVDVNQTYPSTMEFAGRGTALMLAAGRSFPELTRHLIQHGADPNFSYSTGAFESGRWTVSALSMAAGNSDPESAANIALLLSTGARSTVDALMAAVSAARPKDSSRTPIENVRTLLQAGADVNGQLAFQVHSPLALALRWHCHEQDPSYALQLVTTLLGAGADPNLKFYGHARDTPLSWAQYLGCDQKIIDAIVAAGGVR